VIKRIQFVIFTADMSFIPEIEQRPLADQAHFQYEKLKTMLAMLQEKSPFYQRLFKAKKIDIADIRALEDIVKLPTTSKEDLQNNNRDFLCVPPAAVREYTCTSGTLGRPVTIALTEQDLQRLAYNEMLSFQCMGLKQEDIVQLMLTMDRQFMAGMAYYSGIRKIGATIIRSGPGLAKMQWETIERLKTTTVVAIPSFLLKLIAEKPEHFPLENCSVQKVLAIGESLKNEDLQDNALARSILKKWNLSLFSTYASTEMQTAFTECSEKQGGHHHPELLIVELLNDEGLPVKDHEAGEVTITTLGVEAMPLLRYKTGDICKAYYEPCACGRQTMRLGPTLARKSQRIKFKGTTIYPAAAIEVIMQTEEIENYVLRISKNTQEQDHLTFYLNTQFPEQELTEKLRSLFRHKLRVVPEIHFLNATKLREMQYPGNSRKPFKIQDLRNQS